MTAPEVEPEPTVWHTLGGIAAGAAGWVHVQECGEQT